MSTTNSNIDNKNSNTKGTSPRSRSEILIGVVGPCSSGKTTLINGLKEYGYVARHIAQEHSYVPTMWKQITNPDILIYLDVSFDVSQKRRKLDWTSSHFDDQINRLSNARENADLIINTDGKSISEILDQTVQYLNFTI